MARVPLVDSRAGLTPGQQEVWDRIAKSRGRVAGPFGVLLHSPEIARRTADLGSYIRFESALGPADRELAVLTAARAMDCAYEWGAHVPEAVKAGVRREAIEAIGERRAPAGLTPDEAQIVAYVTQLLGRHRVDEPTFAALRARLGLEALVELTATVGYYGMLACTLNAFDVTPDPGAPPLSA
jgi:4-carboxymuconolactone decarboxylase